jgi:hypothetical protein
MVFFLLAAFLKLPGFKTFGHIKLQIFLGIVSRHNGMLAIVNDFVSNQFIARNQHTVRARINNNGSSNQFFRNRAITFIAILFAGRKFVCPHTSKIIRCYEGSAIFNNNSRVLGVPFTNNRITQGHVSCIHLPQ